MSILLEKEIHIPKESSVIIFDSSHCFLASSPDNEFFFVDNDTKISKVAPDSWKKVPTTTLVLFFRVKFFVNDVSLLL